MESIAAAAGWLASEPWLLPPVLALLTHVVCLLCEATRRRTGRAGGHPPPAERPTRDVAAQCGGGPAGPEAAAVHELRVLLLDAQLILPGRYDDDELLRFLQAVKPPLSPLAAFEAVAADVRWRERRRPAKPLGEQLGPPSRRVMLRGLDRHGTPTMLIRPDGDACERPEIFADELLDVLDEHCLSVWRVGGPQRIAIIVDVRAIRPAWLPLAAARELLGTLRAHYPQACRRQRTRAHPRGAHRVPHSHLSAGVCVQRAEAIHVVNLPPVLRWGVAAACAMLDSRTAKKVRPPRASLETCGPVSQRGPERPRGHDPPRCADRPSVHVAGVGARGHGVARRALPLEPAPNRVRRHHRNRRGRSFAPELAPILARRA